VYPGQIFSVIAVKTCRPLMIILVRAYSYQDHVKTRLYRIY
jgi:hypothetical protein